MPWLPLPVVERCLPWPGVAGWSLEGPKRIVGISFRDTRRTHRMLHFRVFQGFSEVGLLSLELFKLVRLPNRVKRSILEAFIHKLTFPCLSALIFSSCSFACEPAFFASSTFVLNVVCSLLAISIAACFSLICAVQGWSSCCLALIWLLNPWVLSTWMVRYEIKSLRSEPLSPS